MPSSNTLGAPLMIGIQQSMRSSNIFAPFLLPRKNFYTTKERLISLPAKAVEDLCRVYKGIGNIYIAYLVIIRTDNICTPLWGYSTDWYPTEYEAL